MIRAITILLILSLAVLSVTGNTGASDKAPETVIRVLILDSKDSVYINLKSSYKMFALNSDRVVMEGARINAKVSAIKDGIIIGDKDLKLPGVKIKVVHDGDIYVDGRRFRGDVDILRKDNAKLAIVNYIDVEDYLYGVLYHEVSHRWPMEALKAQAIAARTFAVYQISQNKAQPYDLGSDIYSQVYGGKTSEKWSTTMAVNLTKGEILTYNGNILPAYYHATCAGYTEDAANMWNVDLAPLKGVPCGFCVNSPHYKWSKEIQLWTLESKLKEKGYNIGKIASINILSRNKSGRVDKLEIKDNAAVSVILTGKDFRQMIGPNDVRSTNFEAAVRWGSLVLDGRGWGHGVGMCQWGAFGMAREGKKAEEILMHYYPGAEITTIDKIKDKI